MAAPAQMMRGLVLKKTKLGETDLIVTVLLEDGSQAKVVAKGARKPASSFASRLELFSEADMLVAPGRSLSVVKEVRAVHAHAPLRLSFEKSACAAAGAELLAKVTHEDLPSESLFALSSAALTALEECSDGRESFVCAAWLGKIFAFSGMRPCLDRCACCGKLIFDEGSCPTRVYFSEEAGGAVCPSCRAECAARTIDGSAWALFVELLFSRFSEIERVRSDASAVREVLLLCQRWSVVHVGSRLKSLTCILDTVV